MRETLRAVERRLWSGVHGVASRFVLLRQVVSRAATTLADVGVPGIFEPYARWCSRYDTIRAPDRAAIAERISRMASQPLISLVMRVADLQEARLGRAIEAVRDQCYSRWELCIVVDASGAANARALLERHGTSVPPIKLVCRERGRSVPQAANDALALAAGDVVAFLDPDGELAPHALYMVVQELNDHPEALVIYSDEDGLDRNGRRCNPHFKPDWSLDLFHGHDMLAHLTAYRTDVVREVGGFREGFEGCEAYDLALRVVERIRSQDIRHIPHVLYHGWARGGSTGRQGRDRGEAHERARSALREHFARRGIAATVGPGPADAFHRVRYALPDPTPLVSIVIPTRDQPALLRRCVDSIFRETTYPGVELVIVDNRSADPEARAYLDGLRLRDGVRVVEHDAPFNFSALVNHGAREARGTVLCLLNDDTVVITRDWLEEMVGHAARAEVGAVGAKLYYADHRIQHAGVVLGSDGKAHHVYRSWRSSAELAPARAILTQNYSAVTGACLVVRRAVFEEVRGFDESFPVDHNDIDFCIRLGKAGYHIVWTPFAELYHLESSSRGREPMPEARERERDERRVMALRWGDVYGRDPFSNPNLSLDAESDTPAFPPRRSYPWRDTTPPAAQRPPAGSFSIR